MSPPVTASVPSNSIGVHLSCPEYANENMHAYISEDAPPPPPRRLSPPAPASVLSNSVERLSEASSTCKGYQSCLYKPLVCAVAPDLPPALYLLEAVMLVLTRAEDEQQPTKARDLPLPTTWRPANPLT
ncbi:hypothetical protein Bbelb_204520 [Branchiostoma belcheri]|nr:hypothetical protein Bbelb_204520 [Branchiostoma belcheri]